MDEHPQPNDDAPWHEARFFFSHPKGLHLRPAGCIAKLAQSFQAEIRICTEHREASARSVLKMLQLEARHNTTLLVKARGRDAQAALLAIGTFLQQPPSHTPDSP